MVKSWTFIHGAIHEYERVRRLLPLMEITYQPGKNRTPAGLFVLAFYTKKEKYLDAFMQGTSLLMIKYTFKTAQITYQSSKPV